jgi:hypothetical protein
MKLNDSTQIFLNRSEKYVGSPAEAPEEIQEHFQHSGIVSPTNEWHCSVMPSFGVFCRALSTGWMSSTTNLRSWNPPAEERFHWLSATLRNHFRRPTKCYREGALDLTFQLPPRSQQHNSGEF